jgi:hypothetical protein
MPERQVGLLDDGGPAAFLPGDAAADDASTAMRARIAV